MRPFTRLPPNPFSILYCYTRFADLFIARARADLSPATSYQRLLVHRCSAYYKLVPENDPITKGIFVLYTADSRMYVYYIPLLQQNLYPLIVLNGVYRS